MRQVGSLKQNSKSTNVIRLRRNSIGSSSLKRSSQLNQRQSTIINESNLNQSFVKDLDNSHEHEHEHEHIQIQRIHQRKSFINHNNIEIHLKDKINHDDILSMKSNQSLQTKEFDKQSDKIKTQRTLIQILPKKISPYNENIIKSNENKNSDLLIPLSTNQQENVFVENRKINQNRRSNLFSFLFVFWKIIFNEFFSLFFISISEFQNHYGLMNDHVFILKFWHFSLLLLLSVLEYQHLSLQFLLTVSFSF